MNLLIYLYKLLCAQAWYLIKTFSKAQFSIIILFVLYFLLALISMPLFGFLFPNFYIEYQKDYANHIIRLMTMVIPISVAIFTFAYKENKDAAYIKLKTSDIKHPLALVIFSSSFTIVGAINPNLFNKKYAFSYIIIHCVISILLFVWYFSKLILSMDLEKNLKSFLKKSLKIIDFQLLYNNKKIFTKKQLNSILNHYSHLNETSFQLFNSLLEKNHFSDNDTFKKGISDVNFKFINKFINNPDNIKLNEFYKQNEEIVQKVANIYQNILLNYRILIRTSTKHKLSPLQNELIALMVRISPITIVDSGVKENNDEIVQLGEQTIEFYFSSVFGLITELCDEDTVEFSYLLDRLIALNEEQPTILKTNQIIENNNTLVSTYKNKMYSLLRSLIIWSIESKNLYILTESVNSLLTIRKLVNTKTPNKRELDESFMNDFFDIFVEDSNDLKRITKFIVKRTPKKIEPQYLNNEENQEDYLKIIYIALLKSIEISNYQSTGYLVKILISNFEKGSIQNYTQKFYHEYLNSMDISITKTNYFHYTISEHSISHCLKKLILLISCQLQYKEGDFSIVPLIANEIKDDLDYIIEKVKNAKNHYGLLSVNEKTLEKLKQRYFFEKVKTVRRG